MRSSPGPGAPLFAGLAGSVLVSCVAPPSFLSFLGFVAASLACTLRLPPWRSPGSVRPLLALLVGLAAGAGICGARLAVRVNGIEAEAVRGYAGTAIEDSVSVSGTMVLHRLALRGVSSGGEAASARAAGTVRIIASGGPTLHAGQSVTVRGRLESGSRWSTDDYESRVKGADLAPGRIASAVLAARSGIRRVLEQRVRDMGYPVSAFFLAMLIGDRSGIPTELAQLFRDAGALHVLALSGTHLVLIYGLASLLLRPLPSARARRILPLVVTAGYFFLAGPLPSLVRAAAMLLVAQAARTVDRQASGVDLLGLGGAAVLLAAPRMLFDVSFQLSFCAVLGMVTAGSALADRMARLVPRGLAVAVSSAAGAQVAVSPVLLAVFGVFQPIGLVSGILVAPVASALLVAGLVHLALPTWLPPAVQGTVGDVLYAAYRALEALLGFFARFPPSRSWVLVGALGAGVAALLAPRAIARRAGRR